MMIVAHYAAGPSVYYDPAWLILIGNTVGVTVVSLAVCYVALRNYRATGRLQILLLGCGVLIFGLGGVLAAAVRSLPGGANLNVTIYNTGAVAGGTFHLAAAFLLLAGIVPEASAPRRGSWLLFGYAGSSLFMLVLTIASFKEAIPPFFIQGVGPTLLRQKVLGAADLLFLLSFIIFLGSYLRTKEAFLYWYACALALTCVSLTAFFIEHSVGSPVGWVGRVSQYVGGVYFLVSLISAARTAQSRGTSMDDVLAASLSGAEERFRALAENSPDAIRRFDPELNQIYVNAAGQRLYGKPARGLMSGSARQADPPDTQARHLRDAVRRVFETGEPVQLEEHSQVGGKTRFFESRCVAERGPQGDVAKVLIVTRDITERKQAAEALRESQERTETILEGIADTFYSLDRDWRFTVVNPAAEKAPFARPAAELLGRVIWELYPHLVGTAIHQHYLNAAKELSLEHYAAQSPLNGRWYEVFMQGWRGGVDVYMRDVTERKAVEAERELLSRQRQIALDAARLGWWNYDPVKRVATYDRRYMEIFGVSGHECPIDDILKLLHPDDLPRVWTAVEAALDPVDRKPYSVEYRVNRCDGAVRWVKAHGLAVFEGEGADRPGASLVGTVEDITDLKQAEEALREADRRKNEFLAALSHELRNPLAPIVSSLYILDHASPVGEQADRAKRVLGRQVEQLSNIVNDLLDITRITRNKIQLNKELLDLNEAVRRTVEDNRSLFERAEVNLDLTLAPQRVVVNADRTRVAQIVGNLLHNSAKFTGRGGRTRVSVAAEAREAVVRIADDGVGMETETLARLFEPFMQAEQTMDRSKGGLGLGLALVKGLVELHDGTITAHSEGAGKGTEMVMRLPLVSEEAVEPQRGRARGGTGARRRVLVIEDNVDAADSLRTALELHGHEVRVAHDGPEGIETARSWRPDMVLCDIGLPGMDGYDVARAFRADPPLEKVRLVAVSGYALPEDQRKAQEAGFELHLAKPLNIEIIDELLGGL